MRVFLAAIIIASVAGSAFAQQKPVPKYGETDVKKHPNEIRAEKEAEEAYQRSLGRIPEQKGTSDPWGSVRSDAAPKAAPKAVAKDPPAKRANSADTAK